MVPNLHSSFYFSAKKENSQNSMIYFVTLDIVTPLCTLWGRCGESGILMQISTTRGNCLAVLTKAEHMQPP